MTRIRFGAVEKATTAAETVSERVKQRDSSPQQAAQIGIDRVAIALDGVFAKVRSSGRCD